MGQRDAGFSTPRQGVQNPEDHQEEIDHRKKHPTSRKSVSSKYPIEPQELIRKVNKIYTIGPKQEDYNRHDVEGSSSDLTVRCNGTCAGDQGGGKIVSVESGNKNNSSDKKPKNQMGRNQAAGIHRSWNSGALRDQVVCPQSS